MDIEEINLKIKGGNKFFLFTMIVPTLVALAFVGVIQLLFPYNMPLILIFTSIITVGVPTLTYYLWKNEKLSEIFVIKKISVINLVYIVAISFFIQPVMTFLSAISMPVSNDFLAEMVAELTKYPFLFALIAIALFPALCEELLMRGVILKFYEDLPLKKMALINGLFFGLLHMNVEQFLYAFLLGFIFVYMYKLTDSLLSPIISHFIINGTQITMSYLIPQDLSEAPTMDLASIFAVFIYAVPFAIICYILMKKFIKNNQEKYDEIAEKTGFLSTEQVKFIDRWIVIIFIVYFAYLAL